MADEEGEGEGNPELAELKSLKRAMSEAADEIEELRREVAKVRRWLGKTGRPLEAPLILKTINDVCADLRGLQETIRRDAEPDYVKELRHEKLVTGNWENEGVSPIVDDDENPIGRAATRYANDPLDYDKID